MSPLFRGPLVLACARAEVHLLTNRRPPLRLLPEDHLSEKNGGQLND